MTNYQPINDWRIRINNLEHGMPHVHVLFSDGSKVVVAIKTREVLAGGVIPARRLNAALLNIAAHEEEYLDEYRRLNP